MLSSNVGRAERWGPVPVVFVLVGLLVTESGAAQFEAGDVIISVSRSAVGFPVLSEGSIKVYSAAGAFKSEIALPGGIGVPVGMRDLNFHNGTLFGSLQGGDVYRIAPNGDLTPAGFTGSFVFDAAGNVYAALNQTIKKFDPAGNHVSTFSLPDFPAYIDLAGDQCTIYYISYSAGPHDIDRYNVCTSQALSTLITGLPRPIGNLRILPGNHILVGTNNGVLRIAPNGQIIRTYLGTNQIALDPDLRSFWASNGMDSISKIDLETGNTLVRTSGLGGLGFDVDSLTVVGEPRAAVIAGAAIPALSHWLLIALAAAVAAVGISRLHGGQA